MNMAHDLPASATSDRVTEITSPEMGQICYVSGYGICTYEGNGRGHEQDSRFANFNGQAFQPVPGYAIKGTQFAHRRRIETLPGREDLTAALDDILTRRTQPMSDIQRTSVLDAKINNQGLSGLVDVLSTTAIRDEREKTWLNQAKTLMACLVAYELGATTASAEHYMNFVCGHRGQNKRDWPKGLPALPANAEQMDAIVDQLRSCKPVDDAFVQGLLHPDHPLDATQMVQQRMAERQKEILARATAPKPVVTARPQPAEPLVQADTPMLATLIARSSPANRAVFQACVGIIPERDLPIINMMIECPQDSALTSLNGQIAPRMTRNMTGFNVTWTPQQTQSHCYDLLDKLTEQAEKTGQLGVAAPTFGLMYEKLNLKVPANIAALIPADPPPAPPRPTAHPSGRSQLSGHHGEPHAVRLSDAPPTPRRPEAVPPAPMRAAPVAPPPPVVVSPPSPPPAAPKLAVPATVADGREEDDKAVAALEKELASGRAAIKGEQRKDMPQPKTGHTPGKYSQMKHVGRLEARNLNYDEMFDDGCQIMGAINDTFPKDPPSGLKVIAACKGKMIQGEFMILSRAMLTPSVFLPNVAISLEKPLGRRLSGPEVRAKYKDLIDRVADHPDYDDADRAYINGMRKAVGLTKPDRENKARATVKTTVSVIAEPPPPPTATVIPPVPDISMIQVAPAPTSTTPIPTATAKIPPRFRHHLGTGITTHDTSTPPPDRADLALNLQKDPNEPRTRAVESEMAYHDPAKASAMVADFAATHLKPFAFLTLSSTGLREPADRISFAQQAAELGTTADSLKGVFKAAAAMVRYQAHKQGMRLLANSPLLDLPNDNPNPTG